MASKTEVLEIKEVRPQMIAVRIVGDTDLVLNKMNDPTARQLTDARKGKGKKIEVPDMWEEIITAMHWRDGKPSEFSADSLLKALAEMCGRTGGWYNGLKDKRTTPQAARLLAKALQLDYEDILKSHAPKEEQIEAEIACEALRDDLSDENGANDKLYHEALENATERLTASLNGIQYRLMCITSALEEIEKALGREKTEIKLP